MNDLCQMRKHELESLRIDVLSELRHRYHRSHGIKYGSLNKGFTEQEFELFLKKVENHKARLLFLLMSGLGLRIGEAVSLKTKDVDIVGRRLWVSKTEKDSVPTSFYLYDLLCESLANYLSSAGETWLFPAVKPSNKYPHVSPNWLRNEFRRARELSGLDTSYGLSDESTGRTERKLFRLTPHSCRHYFGHKVFNATKDLLLTQKLMRHKNIRNTSRYMYCSQEEIDRGLLSTFEREKKRN